MYRVMVDFHHIRTYGDLNVAIHMARQQSTNNCRVWDVYDVQTRQTVMSFRDGRKA